MRNQYWDTWDGGEPRDFYEKAYRRRSLATWDAKWQHLTVAARHSFLHAVKLPDKDADSYGSPPSAPRDNFLPHVLDEFAAAGFVRIDCARSAATVDRVLAGVGTNDFAWRCRILRRMHLLNSDRPGELSKYVEEVFSLGDLTYAISAVLHKVGFAERYYRLDELLKRFVTGHRWQEWVSQALAEPLAIPILKLVKESRGSVPLSELCGQIGGIKPEKVRAVVDRLIGHLVLVEDFQRETWEILVGLLPEVRERVIRASQPRERASLLISESPKELAPHGSVLVNDLRAVLLEIANGPPRLRADRALYEREIERFLSVLDPLPVWLLEALGWSAEARLSQAVEWAGVLQLVNEVAEERNVRLQLSSKGHQWLSGGVEEQYAEVINNLTQAPTIDDPFKQYEALYNFGRGSSRPASVPDELRFFGEHVTVHKAARRRTASRNWGIVDPPEQLALRPHVDRALAALKPGVFYRLDSVSSHLAFGEHNPLNAGLPPDRTLVSRANQPVPPLNDEREEAGRDLIETLVRRRLIPLGCVRAAIDNEGRICIARELSCEFYFGHKIDVAGLTPLSDHAGRVVVQPDFSVIVIGLNPASIADLTLFCERKTKGAGQGATVLKITRESVARAVRLGLKPDDVVARLQRHSSNELPANVLREVKEWSSWVRQVTLSTVTVIRCVERDTADRVMAVLRRQAERISDTMIAIDHAKLTATDRDKLLAHGIILQTDPNAREGHKKAFIGDSIF